MRPAFGAWSAIQRSAAGAGVAALGAAALLAACGVWPRPATPVPWEERPVAIGIGTSGEERPAQAGLLERLVVRRTNEERLRRALGSLRAHARLSDVARRHSHDMARRRFFAHDDPEGVSPADRLRRDFPERVGSSGENIYFIDTDHRLLDGPEDVEAVAERLLAGWMASPGHRANILKSGFTLLGVGVYATEDDVWATQVFSRPLAILAEPLPGSARCGDRLEVRFEPGPDLLGVPELQVLLRWPDPERRFPLPDGRRYLLGLQPLPVERSALQVRVDVVVGDLPGRYALLAGVGGVSWELGSWVAR